MSSAKDAKKQSLVRDEAIVELLDKFKKSEARNAQLQQDIEELRKGNTGNDARLKQEQEMNSSKVKTLLKTINNLKKELQQAKFEKSENVRIQRIKQLTKDTELMEIGMNALRKDINDEEKCDQLIMTAMQKGPKRIRILSREELKIEINKFKNISLRLMQELDANKIKVPGYAKNSKSLKTPETGFREETKKEITNTVDEIEQEADAESQADAGSVMSFDTNNATDADLMQAKQRLEASLGKMQIDLTKKNEKILELLEHIDDLRVTVQVREKAYAGLQEQFEQLKGDLLQAKQSETRAKILDSQVKNLTAQVFKLEEELGAKIENEMPDALQNKEKLVDNKVLEDQVKSLNEELKEKKSRINTIELQARNKANAALNAEKQRLAQEEKAKLELKLSEGMHRESSKEQKQQIDRMSKEREEVKKKLNDSKDQIKRKDSELEKQKKTNMETTKQLQQSQAEIDKLNAEAVKIRKELNQKIAEAMQQKPPAPVSQPRTTTTTTTTTKVSGSSQSANVKKPKPQSSQAVSSAKPQQSRYQIDHDFNVSDDEEIQHSDLQMDDDHGLNSQNFPINEEVPTEEEGGFDSQNEDDDVVNESDAEMEQMIKKRQAMREQMDRDEEAERKKRDQAAQKMIKTVDRTRSNSSNNRNSVSPPKKQTSQTTSNKNNQNINLSNQAATTSQAKKPAASKENKQVMNTGAVQKPAVEKSSSVQKPSPANVNTSNVIKINTEIEEDDEYGFSDN